MILLFKFAIFALIGVSFAMAIAVPATFAWPNGWEPGSPKKRLVLSGASVWFF